MSLASCLNKSSKLFDQKERLILQAAVSKMVADGMERSAAEIAAVEQALTEARADLREVVDEVFKESPTLAEKFSWSDDNADVSAKKTEAPKAAVEPKTEAPKAAESAPRENEVVKHPDVDGWMVKKVESAPVNAPADAVESQDVAEATNLGDASTEQISEILTEQDKADAAEALNHKKWSERTSKKFAKGYAEWLQAGAKSLATKLGELYAKVLAAAKSGMLSIAVVMNFNVTPQLPPVQVKSNAITVTVLKAKPKADFKGVAASADARIVADWMMRKGDLGGKPFIVADKNGGLLYAFDGQGALLAKSPALFGAAKGDVLTAEQASKSVDQTTAADKITPAGVFKGKGNQSDEYGGTVRFAEYENSFVAIHRVYLGTPSEKRMERLQSQTADDNRVSYGCINALPEFIDGVIAKHFTGDSQVVVLPETTDAKSFFGIDDSEFETASTVVQASADVGSAVDISWGADKYGLGRRARDQQRSGSGARRKADPKDGNSEQQTDDRGLLSDAKEKLSKARFSRAIPVKSVSTDVDALGKKERTAFMDAMLARGKDGERILANLKRLEGTPWAKQSIQSALMRHALDEIVAGRQPKFESLMDHPALTKFRTSAEKNGAAGVWAHLQTNGLVGESAKPANNVNSSFLNCDPSQDCAKYCYATTGNYRYVHPFVKAELSNWAAGNDPVRAATIIAADYKTTAEFHLKKALRLFDKGDISAEWLPVIAELNKQGVRVQIFSKRPEVLRQVPATNVRLLSVDKSNLDVARQNPDLPVAFIYTDQTQIPFLNEIKDRVQVILPVKTGRFVLSKEQIDQLPSWTKPYQCPIDNGHKTVGKGASEWNCTRCDYRGGVGCFLGQVTEKVMKAIDNKVSPGASLAAAIKEIQDAARSLPPGERGQLLATLDGLVSAIRAGVDIGTTSGEFRRDEGEAQGNVSPIKFYPRKAASVAEGQVDQESGTGQAKETDTGTPKFSRTSDKWYSQLARVVEGAKQNIAPAVMWKSWLKNQPGIKADEIEATGLNDWLDIQQGKVTKQQVQDYLAQNGVKVEEVMLGGTSAYNDMAMEEFNRPFAELSDSEKEYVRAGVDGATADTAGPDNERTPNQTKFSQYQLPGGENYRELLLTLPKQPLNTTAREARRNELEGKNNRAEITKAEFKELIELRKDQRDYERANFQSSHFDQPNILAHIRFNERTDADGKRVLFIEEIQSDWAQKGKKEGFKPTDNPAERAYNEYASDLKQRYEISVRKDFSEAGMTGDRLERVVAKFVNKDDVGAMAMALDEKPQFNKLNRAMQEESYRTGHPSAPFVTKTEAWVALSMKRMIRYAAENGFDRVAWTNGEQQAARYDLSKQIDRIDYHKGEDGWNISAVKDGAELIAKEGLSDADVEAQVGKDILSRMQEGKGEIGRSPDEDITYRSLTGLNLKVGGEGMKAFYDKIVPNVANDVLKKLGGGRSVPIVMKRGKRPRPFIDIAAISNNRWQPVGANGFTIPANDPDNAVFGSQDAAREAAERIKERSRAYEISQPGFDITPALREKVMAGLPIFSRNEASQGGLSQRDAQAAYDRISKKYTNLPPVTILNNPDELPARLKGLREDIDKAGAANDVEAAYFDGEIVVFSDNIKDEARLEHVLFTHEVTHYGLRGIMGKALDAQLNGLFVRNPELRRKAVEARKRLGLDSNVEAVEEVLADMPDSELVKLKGMDRFIAAIRDWMAGHGFTKLADMLDGILVKIAGEQVVADALVGDIVRAARYFARNGKPDTRTQMYMGGTAFMTAYHGSPHDFDNFSLDKIGTGEGAQAYGWGLYFAGRREVAEHYKKTLSKPTMDYGRALASLPEGIELSRLEKLQDEMHAATIDETIEKNPELKNEMRGPWDRGDIIPDAEIVKRNAPEWDALVQKIMKAATAFDAARNRAGRLYQVNLAPAEDEYLLWDKPLSEQSEKVKAALKAANVDASDNTDGGEFMGGKVTLAPMAGAEFYGKMARDRGSERMMGKGDKQWGPIKISNDEAASKYLASIGIPGIKYLDGSSRNKPLKDVKREFLNELPEDADASEVMEKIGTGTFSPKNEAILKELQANEWLGFDYPAQALSAALSGNLQNWDPSPELVKAVADAQDGSTYNYVIFDDKHVTVEAKFSRAIPSNSIAGAYETLKSNAAQNGRLNTLAELFQDSNKFGILSKTLQTQFHKASKDKSFKRVFDAVNGQINDTSKYALEAEAEAPNILQRMEGFKDVGRTLLQGGKTAQNDLKAVSQAIFANIEGEQGVQQKVFTDAELRNEFSLTPKQIELYREFRAAVDTSMDRLAQTLMMKTAGQYVDTRDMRGLSMDDTASEIDGMLRTRQEFLQEKLDSLDERDVEFQAVAIFSVDPYGNARQDWRKPKSKKAAEEALQDEIDNIQAARDRLQEMRDYTTELKDKGYSPAMRFGQYAVTVMDGDNVEFFSMYETQAEANIARMQLARDPFYRGMDITKSTLNPDSWKMFAGVSPETVELFARFMGADESEGFKAYASLAASSRSAMKRMLERKGVAGFSIDTQRVLAQFVTSNARQASINVNSREVNESLHDTRGDVQSEAQKLVDYVRNPKEEAAALRGLLFMHYIGGSVASALVNMTQPVLMTAPYLHQFAGNKVAGIMARSIKMASTGNISDAGLRQALQKADDEGTTQPHEIHMLMAEASGGAMNNFPRWQAFKKAWGGMFALAESFNRKTTFLAAYEIARSDPSVYRKAGFATAHEFATNAVTETQGLYCVDQDTEILTAAGWKRHGALKAGEAVYAVDDKGALVESRLLDVHKFTGKHPAIEFTANGVRRMVVTNEHTNLIQCYSSRDKKWQGIRRVKTADLKNSHHLLRVPLSSALKRQEVYSDDEVRLFAWTAAEGSLFSHRGSTSKRGVQLVQSESHNPQYVADIDGLLMRLGGFFNRSTSRSADKMVRWRLGKPLWTKIHEALPGKLITPAFVENLSPRQMGIFLETFAMGDGHFPDEGGFTINQKDIGNLDCLQAMAVLSGKTSTVYHRMGKHDFGALYVAKNSVRACVKELDRRIITVDTVWCPETEHGTWIARSNGRTFVTGNSKANRPNWARGAIGATLFTFKQFSISYLELLSRMPRKQQILMLGLLVLAAGAEGLPFAEDVEDLIDTIGQKMGYATNTKKAIKKELADILGDGMAEFVLHGVSAIPGFPLDVSGRMGMANLIPGTALLNPSRKDKSGEVLEVFGAAGGLAKGVLSASSNGKVSEAVPSAIKNLVKGIEMFNTGEYKDAKGRKVTDVDELDAMLKAIGFNPAHVAADTRRITAERRDVDIAKHIESEISEAWAQGILERDQEQVIDARQKLRDWNSDNPDMPIRIGMPQIMKRVKEAKLTRDQRFIKSAPPEMRRRMIGELTQ